MEPRDQENVHFACLFILFVVVVCFGSCCFSWFIVFIFNMGISDDCLYTARNHPMEGGT